MTVIGFAGGRLALEFERSQLQARATSIAQRLAGEAVQEANLRRYAQELEASDPWLERVQLKVGKASVTAGQTQGGLRVRASARYRQVSVSLERHAAPVARLTLSWLGLIALLTLGLGVLMSWLLTRWFVRPLTALAKLIEAFDPGVPQRAPSYVASASEPAELRSLRHALQTLQQTVERQRRDLEGQVETLARQKQELEDAQAQVIHADRLATLGKLGSSFAHEVGNPLSAVAGLLELVAQDLGSAQSPELLAHARAELERVFRLIRQWLQFARPAQPAEASADLDAMLAQTWTRLSASRSFRELRLAHTPDASLPALRMAPDVLGQVLTNLFLNAADAMDAAGTLSVQVESEDGWLILQLDDTGPGIPEAVRATLFDPFVTTKAEGTGLGLAVCAMLVGQAGGRIWAAAAPSGGARLVLRLPTVSSAEASP